MGKGIPGGQHRSKLPSLPPLPHIDGRDNTCPPTSPALKSSHRQAAPRLPRQTAHPKEISNIPQSRQTTKLSLSSPEAHSLCSAKSTAATISTSWKKVLFRISSTSSAKITSRPGCNARKSRKIIVTVANLASILISCYDGFTGPLQLCCPRNG